MLQAFEGIYRNGIIELLEFPENIYESRVLITFLAGHPFLYRLNLSSLECLPELRNPPNPISRLPSFMVILTMN
ncbi:hypothetical protein K4039_02580 [Lyngbya sp. CCAP 1446/10]|uniref:hypothetical protein n=1 Tax=Lyngbya sp. CCAP 1446/10 TaxID=439293 RepID=UPI0022389156|nr:hypothetical protein [Lyngbya sp. CCAP 1446/10]MCW6048990.1 hypothetical protein [Lyngbya sp. CCAP 1446/10]